MAFAISGAAAVTYADRPAGAFTGAVGQYADSASSGAPAVEREWIAVPGVDGSAARRNGFRSTLISLRVFYVAASLAALYQAISDDLLAMSNGPLTVNIGASFAGCYLVPGGGIVGRPRAGDNGCVYAAVAMQFEQRRLG